MKRELEKQKVNGQPKPGDAVDLAVRITMKH